MKSVNGELERIGVKCKILKCSKFDVTIREKMLDWKSELEYSVWFLLSKLNVVSWLLEKLSRKIRDCLD